MLIAIPGCKQKVAGDCTLVKLTRLLKKLAVCGNLEEKT